jgi:AhpD family alkylhydroperoxidase
MKSGTAGNSAEKFKKERETLNSLVLKYGGKVTKRFYGLDSEVYRAGVLDAKTKEMMGLVASLVLRCDDCIKYHILKCWENKVSTEELSETVEIALIVGGSITIPHIRRAYKIWAELEF